MNVNVFYVYENTLQTSGKASGCIASNTGAEIVRRLVF